MGQAVRCGADWSIFSNAAESTRRRSKGRSEMKRKHEIFGLSAAVLLAAGVLAIGSRARGTATTMSTAAPPEVEVAAVEQRDLPIEHEWVGTLDGMVNA